MSDTVALWENGAILRVLMLYLYSKYARFKNYGIFQANAMIALFGMRNHNMDNYEIFHQQVYDVVAVAM